jgi:hypothetical protein
VNACVFVGPTISLEEARAELDAVYLPPVSEGDVYRVACKRPQAIGIIDGYFEHVPSVWHKEILWAMNEGIHIFGSASMGALRAAELAQFGMVGIGKIFEEFRDGCLEDDDEVAVAHAAAEYSYRPSSVAMVDIRATLSAALAANVISPSTFETLVHIAKALFYPERSYESILYCGADHQLPTGQVDCFRHWLKDSQVHQKREDAKAMLRVMREQLMQRQVPKRVSYAFEYTENWELARWLAGKVQLDHFHERAETIFLDQLLDELRLQRYAYARVHEGAMARALMLDESWRIGVAPSREAVDWVGETFRRERGLLTTEALHTWLQENELSYDEFMLLMEDEARITCLNKFARIEAASHIPDYLRTTGNYARLANRAKNKQQTLERLGFSNPTLADTGLAEAELFRWYFEDHLGCPVDRDIARFCRLAGFDSLNSFFHAVLREYCYSAQEGRVANGQPGGK